jgi:hypothetical protein
MLCTLTKSTLFPFRRAIPKGGYVLHTRAEKRVIFGVSLQIILARFFGVKNFKLLICYRHLVILQRSCGTSRLENKASIRQRKNFDQP